MSLKILIIDMKDWRRLGIYKISLVKEKKFIVVLLVLKTHKLVYLVSERTQSEIEKVMNQWRKNVLSQIEEVSMEKL